MSDETDLPFGLTRFYYCSSRTGGVHPGTVFGYCSKTLMFTTSRVAPGGSYPPEWIRQERHCLRTVPVYSDINWRGRRSNNISYPKYVIASANMHKNFDFLPIYNERQNHAGYRDQSLEKMINHIKSSSIGPCWALYKRHKDHPSVLELVWSEPPQEIRDGREEQEKGITTSDRAPALKEIKDWNWNTYDRPPQCIKLPEKTSCETLLDPDKYTSVVIRITGKSFQSSSPPSWFRALGSGHKIKACYSFEGNLLGYQALDGWVDLSIIEKFTLTSGQEATIKMMTAEDEAKISPEIKETTFSDNSIIYREPKTKPFDMDSYIHGPNGVLARRTKADIKG